VVTQPAFLDEREEAANVAPHLSYSRLNRYLLCPEQYRLYYVENLRPKCAAASLVFGKILHQALALLFREQGDPVALFLNIWKEADSYDLSYSQRDSWGKLNSCGQALLDKFVQEETHRLAAIRAVEQFFSLRITTLGLPLIGVIDLLADLDGKRTVVDFKTAAASYEEYEVILSDQLTAYQLAEPDAEQAALCVLVKTKEPRIEWHLATRTGEQLIEFLTKAEYVAREIEANRFYRRSGKWCSWCDYLPVCTGDKQQGSETLIQVR
jgi:hypothetical protein